MSEQRKMRSELRQGLHQFLMQLYLNYTKTNSKEKSIELLSEVIKEEFTYFTNQELKENSSLEKELEALMLSLQKEMNQLNDYNLQLEYERKLDALYTSIELCKERGK